jgi:hypothetical protein
MARVVRFLKNYNDPKQAVRVEFGPDATFHDLVDTIREKLEILEDVADVVIRRGDVVFASGDTVASTLPELDGRVCFQVKVLPGATLRMGSAAASAPAALPPVAVAPPDTSRAGKILLEVELETKKARRETLLVELHKVQGAIMDITERLRTWSVMPRG